MDSEGIVITPVSILICYDFELETNVMPLEAKSILF